MPRKRKGGPGLGGKRGGQVPTVIRENLLRFKSADIPISLTAWSCASLLMPRYFDVSVVEMPENICKGQRVSPAEASDIDLGCAGLSLTLPFIWLGLLNIIVKRSKLCKLPSSCRSRSMKATGLPSQLVQTVPCASLMYLSVHEQGAICCGSDGIGIWFVTCPNGSHWLKKSPISWPSKTCSAATRACQ